jgi:hypothetical protein
MGPSWEVQGIAKQKSDTRVRFLLGNPQLASAAMNRWRSRVVVGISEQQNLAFFDKWALCKSYPLMQNINHGTTVTQAGRQLRKAFRPFKPTAPRNHPSGHA